MYTIKKEFHFSASHQLHGLEAGHPCGRNHGHNYIVVVELKSEKLDETGFVLDYGKLKPIGDFIQNNFDHQFLNERMADQPSAENIAKLIYVLFKPAYPLLSAVEVKETEKTTARYEDKPIEFKVQKTL